MDIGMLWYDDDTKRKLDEKVARAAQYYQTKYGVAPTVCYLHPSMLANTTAAPPTDGPPQGAGASIAGGVQLRSARTVLVNHFWIGLGEPTASAEAKATKTPKSNPTGALRRVRSPKNET